MSALDGFTAVKALGMGAVLSSVNPKNLVLLLAGVASISASSISGTQQAIVLIALASLSIAVPVGACFALGDRAEATLMPTKDWLARNNGAVMAVILVVFGAKLLGDGIRILS